MATGSTPIRVKGIDHVTVIVRDLERSRAFYCDLLGMEPIERPAFPFAGLWFRSGGTQVHLIADHEGCADPGYPNLTPATKPGRIHHFAFEVDDANAAAERLREQGIQIQGGPVPRPDGCIQCWFHDPDGHIVEVFHRAPPR